MPQTKPARLALKGIQAQQASIAIALSARWATLGLAGLARLMHIASRDWGKRRNMNMKLLNSAFEEMR